MSAQSTDAVNDAPLTTAKIVPTGVKTLSAKSAQVIAREIPAPVGIGGKPVIAPEAS